MAILLWACWLGKAWVLWYYLNYAPQEGDIVFQSLPHCELADAIEGVTRSPYSHCGAVLREDGQWVVIEAIVSVRETPLLRWMQRGRGAGFAVYRPDARYQAALSQFKTALRSYLGKPYDYDYEMSDKAIYCSELVYKGFKTASGEELGKLERLGDLNWQPFTGFIKSMQGAVPADRVMITPASLARAPQIRRIVDHEMWTK